MAVKFDPGVFFRKLLKSDDRQQHAVEPSVSMPDSFAPTDVCPALDSAAAALSGLAIGEAERAGIANEHALALQIARRTIDEKQWCYPADLANILRSALRVLPELHLHEELPTVSETMQMLFSVLSQEPPSADSPETAARFEQQYYTLVYVELRGRLAEARHSLRNNASMLERIAEVPDHESITMALENEKQHLTEQIRILNQNIDLARLKLAGLKL